jgi:hypothetical protein
MRSKLGPIVATLVGSAVLLGCSGGVSNGSTADAGSITDSAAADGAPADHAAVDARRRGPYDSSASYDDSGALCPMPAALSNWPTPEYRHAKHEPTACSLPAITAFDTACLGANSSMTACMTFMTANATCYACLVSQATDATWGPVYLANNIYQANLGGCIELTDPANVSCAQAQEYSELCEHAACDMQCPVTTSASFTAYQECTAAADQEACSQYTTAAVNCLGAEDAAGSICNPPSSSFDAYFLAIAPLFCSGASDGGASEAGPADGGPVEGGGGDGGSDAPAE